MGIKNIFVFLLFLSVFIETTIFSFPFLFAIALPLYVFFPEARILFLIFIASLLVDILKSSGVGLYPLAILSSFLAIGLYKKAFEIKDYKVILATCLIATFTYAKLASYSDNLIIYLLVFGGLAAFFSYFQRSLKW